MSAHISSILVIAVCRNDSVAGSSEWSNASSIPLSARDRAASVVSRGSIGSSDKTCTHNSRSISPCTTIVASSSSAARFSDDISFRLRVSRSNSTIAGRGRAYSPAPEGRLLQFRRSQTGGCPRPETSLTTWMSTVRSLLASQARIGAGLPPFPGIGADIAHGVQFVEPARPLAGRSRAYPGVPTGAARLPAAISHRAAGRPGLQRVRSRAPEAGYEQSSAARALSPGVRAIAASWQPTRLHRSTAAFLAGAA